MHPVRLRLVIPSFLALCLACPVAAIAGDGMRDGHHRGDRPSAFLEATGAWGFNFGETDYLPAGSDTDFRHPLVTGFSFGGTAGLELSRGLALIAAYDYTTAKSREGDVPGVLDEVRGRIKYHTLVGGVRLMRHVGFGRLRVEFAAGIVFPYHTELELTYGPALAAIPDAAITGVGTQRENYNIAFGGHGAVGYELPITHVFYVAAGLKLRTFQGNNKGKTTEYENFVTDFEGQPPVAITAEIDHESGAASPTTNSVQDIRLQLSLGARF